MAAKRPAGLSSAARAHLLRVLIIVAASVAVESGEKERSCCGWPPLQHSLPNRLRPIAPTP